MNRAEALARLMDHLDTATLVQKLSERDKEPQRFVLVSGSRDDAETPAYVEQAVSVNDAAEIAEATIVDAWCYPIGVYDLDTLDGEVPDPTAVTYGNEDWNVDDISARFNTAGERVPATFTLTAMQGHKGYEPVTLNGINEVNCRVIAREEDERLPHFIPVAAVITTIIFNKEG